MTRGTVLRAYFGNMFSGKSEHIVLYAMRRLKYLRKPVLAFKPTTDTRSKPGLISSHDGKLTLPAIELPNKTPQIIFKILKDLEKNSQRPDTLVFDEVQFYTNEFAWVVNELLKMGYNAVFAGLILDFKREAFTITNLLMSLCEDGRHIEILTSGCEICGRETLFAQRLVNGAPAPYDSPQIQVGGHETYVIRCIDHHELPDRPSPLF